MIKILLQFYLNYFSLKTAAPFFHFKAQEIIFTW